MHLSLLSVTTTVTGSKTLVSYKSRQILVDCDLFQGYTCLREMNRDEFPLDRTRSGLSVDVSAQSPRCAAAAPPWHQHSAGDDGLHAAQLLCLSGLGFPGLNPGAGTAGRLCPRQHAAVHPACASPGQASLCRGQATGDQDRRRTGPMRSSLQLLLAPLAVAR